MNKAQQNQGVVEVILRTVYRQKLHSHSSPHAAPRQAREDIHPGLLNQIKAEATRAERQRLLASDRSRNLLTSAFQALKPQFSRR